MLLDKRNRYLLYLQQASSMKDQTKCYEEIEK
jgi:hypothetical protein